MSLALQAPLVISVLSGHLEYYGSEAGGEGVPRQIMHAGSSALSPSKGEPLLSHWRQSVKSCHRAGAMH